MCFLSLIQVSLFLTYRTKAASSVDGFSTDDYYDSQTPAPWVDLLFIISLFILFLYYSYLFTKYSLKHIHVRGKTPIHVSVDEKDLATYYEFKKVKKLVFNMVTDRNAIYKKFQSLHVFTSNSAIADNDESMMDDNDDNIFSALEKDIELRGSIVFSSPMIIQEEEEKEDEKLIKQIIISTPSSDDEKLDTNSPNADPTHLSAQHLSPESLLKSSSDNKPKKRKKRAKGISNKLLQLGFTTTSSAMHHVSNHSFVEKKDLWPFYIFCLRHFTWKRTHFVRLFFRFYFSLSCLISCVLYLEVFINLLTEFFITCVANASDGYAVGFLILPLLFYVISVFIRGMFSLFFSLHNV